MKVYSKYLPIILLTLPLFLMTPDIALAEADYFAKALWVLVNNLFGLFVGLSGYLLDFGVNTFVIGFGQNFLQGGVGAVVDKLWSNVRDIFNITFIFGLIYIGFKMILDSSDSNTKRGLIYLIMAALLVNFSLYITKFIIDFSNILATQIAQKGFQLTNNGDVAISSTLLGHFGLSSVLNYNGGEDGLRGTGSAAYGYIFGTAFLYIVATFVFAAGGMMLAIRYAVLCLYMVLSPLMFLGWVFPQLASESAKYWRGFLGRAFFAPLYILLVFFAVTIIAGFFGNGRDPKFDELLSGNAASINASFGTTFAPFVLSCIFLIAAVVVSNKLGANGAEGAIRIGNNIRGRMQRGVGAMAGGATIGIAARGMRNTVGRGANSMVNNEKFKRHMASMPLGRQVFNATAGVAGASFDARRIGGAGQAMGIGGGVAGGYAKTIADNNAADEKFMKSIAANVDMNDPEVRKKINTRAFEIKKEAEEVIAGEQAKLKETEAEKAEKKRETENEKEKLVAKQAEAKAAGNTNRVEELQKEIEVRESELEKIDKNYEAIIAVNNERIAALKAKANTAVKYAESETKYANEIAYMKQLEASEQFWKSTFSVAGGAGAGSYGVGLASSAVLGAGALTGGAAIAGLIGGAFTAHARGDRHRASRENLARKWGNDGMKMADAEAQKKQLGLLAEALREQEKNNSPAPAPEAPNSNPTT